MVIYRILISSSEIPCLTRWLCWNHKLHNLARAVILSLHHKCCRYHCCGVIIIFSQDLYSEATLYAAVYLQIAGCHLPFYVQLKGCHKLTSMKHSEAPFAISLKTSTSADLHNSASSLLIAILLQKVTKRRKWPTPFLYPCIISISVTQYDRFLLC